MRDESGLPKKMLIFMEKKINATFHEHCLISEFVLKVKGAFGSHPRIAASRRTFHAYFGLAFGSRHELWHAVAPPSLTGSFFTPKCATSVANKFGAEVLAQPQISCSMQRL